MPVLQLRNHPLVVSGQGNRGFDMARALTCWSDNLVLCTDGPSRLSAQQKAELRRNRIDVRDKAIVRLLGAEGYLRALEFADGTMLA